MIRIVIIGSREIRHKTGCCGSRNQEEVVSGYIDTLYRAYGRQNLRCRYVDIDDPGAGKFAEVVEAVRREEIGLPVAIRNGNIIAHGQDALYKLADHIRDALRDGESDDAQLETLHIPSYRRE